ncbi:DUF3239 domain-containing protein [Corynebacterium epidermidicanis]|uniref:Putative DUF3239 family protein n=1 Tax=Corynebacterium epidermidicanis TaxID=1050174 RepID=A0A0G3GPS9_9CORY|nr:DUF3239 domain-containing protein [Corynebacterium epidermidicanis]AKK02595.1 putative DUF3239 family protein [Corynebacterium epidermidicanis]
MRTFHFTVDENYNKAHNEYSKDVTRLQLSAGVLGALLLAVALGIFFLTTVGWRLVALVALGTFAIFCFSLIFILPRQIGGAQRLYDSYELVPAIVAEVNPRDLVLMALVNASADPAAQRRPALALRTVTKLEGHPTKVGVRVPSVAVSGRRSIGKDAQWDEISPMPIAWATPDRSVLVDAERAIPEAEWRRLDKLLPRLKDVQTTTYNLLVL